MSFSVTPALLNLWGYGFVLATGLFFTVWLVAERTKNGGIVDVFWGFGFALVAALYFGVDVFVWQNPVSINKLLLAGHGFCLEFATYILFVDALFACLS
jgi:steroid 5-alpha reductase family enzyme